MQAETEYRFQHEQTPDSNDEAGIALNRTLWLHRWYSVQKNSRNSVLTFLIYCLFAVLLKVLFTDSLSFYTACLVVALMVAVLMTIPRGGIPRSMSTKTKNDPTRSKEVLKTFKVLCWGGLIIGNIGHSHFWIIGCYFPALLYLVLSDWTQMRKLRKNMIKWGLLRPRKPMTYQPPHMAVQLKESEAVVDNTMGAPKERLFKKSSLTAR